MMFVFFFVDFFFFDYFEKDLKGFFVIYIEEEGKFRFKFFIGFNWGLEGG